MFIQSIFTGTASVTTDESGAGFDVEIAPSSNGNFRDYYVTVTDFTQLEVDKSYKIKVSSNINIINTLNLLLVFFCIKNHFP